MESSEIFQAIDLTEFSALTDKQQSNIMGILAFGYVNPDGREKDLFVQYFGAGSNTITQLQADRLLAINRARELGIPNVYEPDVTAARAL